MRYLLTITGILLCSSLLAQNFSTEPDKFVKELETFMTASKKDEMKAVMDEFSENYERETLRSDQIGEIISLANKMKGRGLRAFPYFQEYLSTINSFKYAKKDYAFFKQWIDIADQVLENQKKGDNKLFQAFMEFSNALFAKQAFYSSQAKTWAMVGTEYDLLYQNKIPSLRFRNTDFYGYTTGDTIVIKNTSGVFFPFTQIVNGKEGQITWERAALDPEMVYAELDFYKIDVSKQKITIDTVEFFYKPFFADKPLYGKFEDQLIANNKPKTSTFPRFESFNSDFAIPGFADRVDFTGGLSMTGSRIYGSGTSESPASLKFYDKNGRLAISARSQRITIKKPISIGMKEAEISIYFGDDSLYHPGADLKYLIGNREAQVNRGKQGMQRTKFVDSYHKQEIEADVIKWELDRDYMEISMVSGAGQNPAVFESENYFNSRLIRQIRGTASYDPLSILKRYYERSKSNEISAENFAKAIDPNLKENQIKSLLYEMMEQGFIFYDSENSQIIIKDKTVNYVKYNAKRADYDNISIASRAKKSNVKFNLENYDFEMRGVEIVPVSDSSVVYFFPKNKEMTLKKDRDMEFNGTVYGGRLDFEGEGFYFNYAPFILDLRKVDSMFISIPDGDKIDQYGDPKLMTLRSSIENLQGTLEINHQKNKSGNSKLLMFPKLNVDNTSNVFYDKRSTLAGVYKRDNFYFEIDPFKMDSLNKFHVPSMKFDGRLHSAGIFPVFEESLKMQKDLSLGFITRTPPDGYDLYQGKGKNVGTITLDNTGLKGQAAIEYQTSHFTSENVLYRPKQLNATADTFYMEKRTSGLQFPHAYSANNTIDWRPYTDSMDIKMNDRPFKMYEDQTTLVGDLAITDKGLFGNGTLDWDEAKLSSKKFAFKADDLSADTASLEIKNLEGDKVTFNTPNVNAKVDFKERVGEFKSNIKDIATEFAYNQYVTAINEFTWDMDAKILDFRAPPESEGAYFQSTRPDQKGLKFLAKAANYDLSTSIMKLYDVPYIKVADAKIIPDSGRVTIDPAAEMRELKNASIVADTLGEHHTIEEVTTKITAIDKMTGNGVYTFRGDGLEEQKMIMDKIYIDKKESVTTNKLIATGNIPLDDKFKIYNQVNYQGDVKLTSVNPYLKFSGFSKIDFDSKNINTNWFSINQDIDPSKIYFYYDDPKSPEGNDNMVGISLPRDPSLGMQTHLFGVKSSKSDDDIFTAKGIMEYRPSTKTYAFGDEAKIAGETLEGNVLRLNDKTGEVTADGLIDFHFQFGAIDVISAGTIKNVLADGTYEFNVTMGLDMKFEKNLDEQFGLLMYAENSDNPEVDYSTEKFESQMRTLIDDKEEKKWFEEFNKTGLPTRPKNLYHNVILTDITLIYDPIEQTYRSKGDFGIMLIGEQAVHLMMDGYLEFGYKGSTDYFHMYVETSLQDWFYLNYRTNNILITSSFVAEFNRLITELDADKRKITKKDNRFYLFTLGSKNKMKAFKERMKAFEK